MFGEGRKCSISVIFEMISSIWQLLKQRESELDLEWDLIIEVLTRASDYLEAIQGKNKIELI